METVKTTVDEKICTGCGACENICPVDAIDMLPNHEGFIVPSVNFDKCVSCGKCTQICPALNYTNENSSDPTVYAVRANDEIRKVSSSGGMFTLIAKTILKNGGVVYGAAFDENMQLHHICAETMEELAPLRGSKYVQSNVGLVYRDIKQKLEGGREGLFVGTPCQVIGLKNYLGKSYDRLFTVDLVCHGVPSQSELDRYLHDKFPSKKAVDINFRDKKHGWGCSFIDIKFSDGSEYSGSRESKDPYEIIFHRNLGLRKSCSDCKFCAFPRCGDLTMGDFWGISKINPKLSDGLGTSVIMINSDKGKALFGRIKNKDMKCDVIAVKAGKLSGNRFQRINPANKNRDRYFDLLKNYKMSDAISLALEGRYGVGLVSNWYAGNFGGSLTQYALYHTIRDMGFSVLMIERPADATDKASIKTVEEIYKEFPYPSFAVSKQYSTKEQMRALNNVCDRFVVGSDQLFQYTLYCDLGKFVTLDWVDDTKHKIAYAASYGHDHMWGDKNILTEMAYFIKKFDFFSVREKSGVEITKKYFGVDAECVLDPVFLCNTKYYDELIDKSDRTLPEHYIASYILDPDSNKYSVISLIKSALKMPEEVYSELGYAPDYVKPLKNLNIVQLKMEERLQSIKHCDFFVTDSFHGTCFAIIFKKQFVSVLNTNRGGSRFQSLLSMLHLEHRLVKSADEIPNNPKLFEPINYNEVYKILKNEKIRCRKLLRSALSSTEIKPKTDYDIMRGLIEIQQREIDVLQKQNSLLNQTLKVLCGVCGMGFASSESINEYLEQLNSVKDKFTIFISVKDTPGIAFQENLVPIMKRLGLNVSLCDQHWHPYIAVIDCGKVLYEKLGEIQEKLSCELMIGEIKTELSSAGYKHTNLSQIIIDGTDYSKNMRGLNFVVYDKTNHLVCDSVCFDTNLKSADCYR